MMIFRQGWPSLLLLIALGFFIPSLHAAPEKDYWSFWDKSNEANKAEVGS